MSSNGKTALVTGAGRGLGLALCSVLLGRGWQVIACVRDPERVLPPPAPGLRIERLDLTDPPSVQSLAERLAGLHLDLVLHNAAIRGDTGGLSSLESVDFMEVMKVNVAGPMLLTRALMGQVPAAGCMAFVSSRAGSMAEGHDPDGDYAYCASKAALNRMVVKLAADYPQVFLALHPGWVKTDMGGEMAEVTPAESAEALITLIEHSSRAESGGFRAYNGATIAW